MNTDDDPLLWLEEVQGEAALAWVRQRNAETEALLATGPQFETTEREIRAILDSREQIPYVVRRGAAFYNLWRDAEHPRGLWRRTSLASFREREPAWETVIDLDTLARDEGENWVWAGATALGPAYRRCIVALSRGGADATVLREFDLVEKRFVDGGFAIAEAKSRVVWEDEDHLLVGTDLGPGSLTDSGYPRTIRRWRRGTALAEAPLVFEGRASDVSVGASVDRTPGWERTTFERAIDFYRSETFLLGGTKLVKLDKPEDASIVLWRELVLVELRSDWVLPGATWPRGSLLVGDATAFLAGDRRLQPLFTPSATRSLASWTATRSAVIVNVLDNVASRLEEWRRQGDDPEARWTKREVDAPHPGALSVTALHDPLLADDPLAETLLVNVADFLSPDSLRLGEAGRDGLEVLKSRPSFFDAQGMRAEQHFATSADGTRVPYFVLWPRGAKADGRNPTLLYGYGGFEVSMTPFYSGVIGSQWCGRGGVFVLANLRGGGEFGPGWHQAAVVANKQRSYDDLAAVAEDLIARGITSPAHLGIQGGSNGGLLVGAVMLQRPELFSAVVCQVPLLDMKRFHKLLAGASWMAEYGNPDLPEDWAVISRYSPYQRVLSLPAGRRLPAVLFTTSTRDDRVHPGHARKMAERMRQLGHEVLYWENIEGGHGGAADNAQRARMSALEYGFLWRQLARG